MKVIHFVILLLVFQQANELHAQTDTANSSLHLPESGEYSVGFQLLEKLDHSRAVTGGTSPSVAHPRPMRTYFWYPASRSEEAQFLRFGRRGKRADGQQTENDNANTGKRLIHREGLNRRNVFTVKQA